MRMHLIAVMGVDGSGKTTLVERLNATLQNGPRKCHVVYMGRGRERILPGGKSLAKAAGIDIQLSETIERGTRRPHRALRIARDAWYLLDAYARYLWHIWPRRLRGEITITDRYAYDVLLNEGITGWVRWIILHLYPAPDLLIYLHHELDVLSSRRPFYKLEHLAGEVSKLNQLVRQVEGLNRSVVLRLTPENPEEALSSVLPHVR
jgi:thymidylate kinase